MKVDSSAFDHMCPETSHYAFTNMSLLVGVVDTLAYQSAKAWKCCEMTVHGNSQSKTSLTILTIFVFSCFVTLILEYGREKNERVSYGGKSARKRSVYTCTYFRIRQDMRMETHLKRAKVLWFFQKHCVHLMTPLMDVHQ
jgi:hypothetical protein